MIFFSFNCVWETKRNSLWRKISFGACTNFIHYVGFSQKLPGIRGGRPNGGVGEHTKTDSQVVHMLDLLDIGFKITVINVFSNIDYQMENFKRYLKAIKINQMESYKLKNNKKFKNSKDVFNGFKKFLLGYSWFTILCYFLLCSKVNQLYICIYPLFVRFFSHIGHCSVLSRVPYAIH